MLTTKTKFYIDTNSSTVNFKIDSGAKINVLPKNHT